MSRKIYFRADASPEIGMGHFTRSLALASMLKDTFDCCFVTIHPTPWQLTELNKISISYIILKNAETHFDDFYDMVNGGEIVVLDNYYFNSDYQLKLKNKGCQLMCIDDIHDKHYYADIVLNHSPSVRKEMFSLEHYTKLLLGLKYVLLREEFLKEAKSNKSSGDNTSGIVLCFGGSDMPDTTGRILNFISGNPEISHINVIVGSAYTHTENLINHSKINSRISVYQNLSPSEIIRIAGSSVLAIVPASTVLFEMLSVRTPVITGYFADNQIDIASDLINAENGIFDGGNFLRISKDDINSLVTKALKSDIKEIKKAQSGLIDGNSGWRILNEMERLK